jgi:hypothetical protein
MEQFGKKEDCDPAELAWYDGQSRRVYETDCPALVRCPTPATRKLDTS